MSEQNLESHPLNALTEDDLLALRQCGRSIRFEDGKEILHQGEHNASLYVVERGSLHAFRDAAGRRRVFLGRLEAGSVFGEISLFDPGPTTASVAATEPGELLEISGEDFRRFAELRPVAATRLLLALTRQMASRLRRTDQRLMDAIVWGESGR